MSEVQPISYVLLDEDISGQVHVKRKNRDQFFLSLGEAVTACAAFAASKQDFTNQMSDLLDVLSDWVVQRSDRIKSAYLSVRPDNSTLFVVMQKEVPLDAALSDALTELDIQIADDEGFSLINLDVLAIPSVSRESANAFLSSGRVFSHA